ncbi:MAG TPA: hypothetical protein VK755_04325 [Candidatus Acidoferrales bacterium]|jgi:hypothetical protein|nr:hypothetical protein [Candidatus Acidoferrales bacterium]
MKIPTFGYALSFGAASALLAGCGGPQTSIGVPSMSQQSAKRDSYDVCTGHGNMLSPWLTVRPGDKRHRAFPRGLTPANLQAAYDLPSMSNGHRQIVALVEVCDNPSVASDQAEYRSEFQLPSGKLYKFNEYGERKNYPPARKPLGVFIDGDVEMVAAVCPNCTIDLIEANGEDQSDLQTAAKTAVSLGAHIVSNDWACIGYGCVDKSYFDANGVTYVGLGAVPQPDEAFPADFDTVVAVGGTYLTQGGGGKRGWTETIWKRIGGGCFSDVPKPSWQTTTGCSGRVSNDVSIVANSIVIFDSYDGLGSDAGWLNVSGNNLPTALISGVFGLAGNARTQDGGRTFWSKKHQKHLYKVECYSSCVYGGRFSYPDGWGTPHGIEAF